MRADVVRRLGPGLAENLVVELRVLGPADILPGQHMRLIAVVARHEELALVAGLVAGIYPRQALDRRRAAEDDLAARERLGPLLEQGDGVALVVDVLVTVVRLFHCHHWGRRGFHRARAVGADELQEATGKALELPAVVPVALLVHRDFLSQARRRLDHWHELLVVELLRRAILGEHDDHRAGIDIDSPAHIVQQHAIRPGDLCRFLRHHLGDSRIVQGLMDAGHPGRQLRVIPARPRRCLRRHPPVPARPVRRRHLLGRRQYCRQPAQQSRVRLGRIERVEPVRRRCVH